MSLFKKKKRETANLLLIIEILKWIMLHLWLPVIVRIKWDNVKTLSRTTELPFLKFFDRIQNFEYQLLEKERTAYNVL